MSCNLSYGIALDCIDSIGGVKGPIYIGADVDFGTLTVSSTTGTNSLITGATGDSGSMYSFEVAKDVAQATETWTISNTNGTAFFAQALSFNIQKMSADKRNELLLVARNRNLKAIFQDNNGRYWLVGLTRGAVVTAGTAVTGTQVGDLNGYTMTLTAHEPQPMYEVDSTPESVFTGIDFIPAS